MKREKHARATLNQLRCNRDTRGNLYINVKYYYIISQTRELRRRITRTRICMCKDLYTEKKI